MVNGAHPPLTHHSNTHLVSSYVHLALPFPLPRRVPSLPATRQSLSHLTTIHIISISNPDFAQRLFIHLLQYLRPFLVFYSALHTALLSQLSAQPPKLNPCPSFSLRAVVCLRITPSVHPSKSTNSSYLPYPIDSHGFLCVQVVSTLCMASSGDCVWARPWTACLDPSWIAICKC